MSVEGEARARANDIQFQNREVCEAVVFVIPDLRVQVVFEDGDIGWVISVYARDEVFDDFWPCRGVRPLCCGGHGGRRTKFEPFLVERVLLFSAMDLAP